MRPDNPENELLHLSRRARFSLRLHRDNIDKANDIVGAQLDVDGHALKINDFKQQLLIPQSTIFSRYVLTSTDLSEDDFLNEVAPEIQALGFSIKKMMGGRQHTINTPKGPLATRSLMLSDLEKEESIALQQNGIGDKQLLGMGIFLPHKGITAVTEINDDLPPGPN
jgi:CRISPR-associated protein Cas6